MADIRVLPKQMAELIAAGEVVERPASVIKELCENAIDAGATKITVEIQNGGITYMRVTDNGSGIKHSEVPTAFLRHATSKIRDEKDLFNIGTLGFRGEALASISSVARVEMLTKTADEDFGTRYVIEGGEQTVYEEAGCPEGTTIIVRDIFYNIPARMKFMKKDATEAMYISALMDNLALCNRNVAIKLIKDGKIGLSSTGDGKLVSAIYSTLGREYAAGLIAVDSVTHGIRVSGMVSKPVNCRPSRSGQYFSLNNRIIKSGAAVKALENAYKNAIMVGKFPSCVLNIELPFDRVDVNVHPAKTEVRFHDEKAVFEAVYYAVKNAIVSGDIRPELELKKSVAHQKSVQSKPTHSPAPFSSVSAEEYKKIIGVEPTAAQLGYLDALRETAALKGNETSIYSDVIKAADYVPEKPKDDEPVVIVTGEEKVFDYKETIKEEPVRFVDAEPQQPETINLAPDIDIELKYIGEAYKTYIIVEFKGSLYFIDKHAAHERILFEKLKAERTVEPQYLITPISVTLSRAEHKAVIENLDLLSKAGFEIEEFGTVSVLVRAVPAELADSDIMFSVCEVADSLLRSGTIENEKLENLYHTVACRAAIKGGNDQSPFELEALAKRILSDNDIMYCPHGRPVAFELKRSELERQFGRTK